ncbi:MAG: hypothetical protein J5J04_14040, partial [Anaerolineae bacterium]|nr:hypothetical protein [Anaerolineae bacterium]
MASTLTQQLYSQNHWLADGVDTVWNFTFGGGYLDRSHVKAYMQSPQGDITNLTIVDGDFITDFSLQIVPAVPAGYTLVIYRDTPKDAPLVDFLDGARVTEESLDTVAKQSVMIGAEVTDFFAVGSVGGLVDLAEDLQTARDQTVAAIAEVDADAAAAEAARAAAVVAQLAAELAETNAELAEVNAEAAQAAALGSANAAASSASDADADRIAAQAARVGAETAETNAETAETNAEAAQAAAEASADAAAISETNAAASASAALASALAAAGSADAAADLFTSTGASLIGYTHPGVGAVPRTQDEKNAEVVTPEDFGAAGDGVTDDTAALQAAIDALALAGGGDLLLMSRDYLVLDVTLKSGVNIIGRGDAKLIKNGGLDETYILKGEGALGASTAISAPVPIGATSFTVASAAGLAVGDWVIVRDATYVSGSAGRNQEINCIAGIAGTTITLQRPTHAAYSGSQEMVKLTPVEAVRVEGVSFVIPTVAGGNVGGCVYLQYAVGCAVRACRFRGAGGDASIGFDTVAFSEVEGCDFADGQNMSAGGYGYGIEFNEATHHCIAR